MLNFDLDKMLFRISPEDHDKKSINEILMNHPEVWYVSFVGIDIGGHDTDEKIPVTLFLDALDDMLENGVKTDGSSVALPKIAALNNAKVSIIPDSEYNWYVDYNYRNIDYKTGLPVGTLRIPSYLIHDDRFPCGSRVILKKAIRYVEQELLKILEENPYVFEYLGGIDGVDEIEKLRFTSATELEFWVRTPDDKGDREQLFTSQVLKEQYWKRTFAEVRTALEDTLKILDSYGFGVEMGHKEVGGVKPHMSNSGQYDHVMEQLEIDWLYTDAIQAADNENQIKYIIRDIFTMHGLDVTFMAKPISGVAGSGKHTHMGLAADLKSGKKVNLFSPSDMQRDYLSPIGFGALMGLLKHYEVISPFVSSSNDAMNRLKPGYEAPVCIVTSLGRSSAEPSRNRTVLTGLIRNLKKPLATRFELRAPNPKSNTYLVLAASWMAMIDGIKYALTNEQTPKELEKSLSKKYGEDDPYLEKYREYRSEKEIYEDYTEEEREKLFGKAPATVWENIAAFDRYPEKLKTMKVGGVMEDIAIESYKVQVISHWKTELHDRLIPEKMNIIRSCRKADMEAESDLDRKRWKEIDRLRHDLGKESLDHVSLLKQTKDALDKGDWSAASDLQVQVQTKMAELIDLYSEYKKNIL